MASGVQNLSCSALARSFGTSATVFNKNKSDAADTVALVEPLPAVAYDFVDDDDHVNDDPDHDHHALHWVSTSAVKQNPEVSSSAGGRITSVPPPGSASFEGRALPSRKSGGGGGGGTDGGSGRHRCPKCGTSVTFRHGDFEEST